MDKRKAVPYYLGGQEAVPEGNGIGTLLVDSGLHFKCLGPRF